VTVLIPEPSNPEDAARHRVEGYTLDPFLKAFPPSSKAYEAAVAAEMLETGAGRKIMETAATKLWRMKRECRN
jgi:hypothetical protein